MTVEQILATLKKQGNETTRKVNRKNGAGENQFGVKLGDLRTIAKKIKPGNELALSLWDTNNVDARLLSVLLMVPKKLAAAEIDHLARSVSFGQEADWFNAYILKEYPEKEKVREVWMNSDNRWLARSGWSLTAGRVARDREGIDLDGLLRRIEREMAEAPSVVQWTMNTTLANIGIYSPAHRERAIGIGEKLGIFKDYPVSKGCTSPFAPDWIRAVAK